MIPGIGCKSFAKKSPSMDGKYQYATTASNVPRICRSEDHGVTWATLSLPELSYKAVGVSSTGQYVTAVANSYQYAFVSSDYGVNWTEVYFTGNYLNFQAVIISDNGRYQSILVSSYVGWFNSTNYGVSFTQTLGDYNWRGQGTVNSWGEQGIASAASPANPFMSYDNGASFSYLDIPVRSYQDLQISHINNYKLTAVNQGYVYRSVNGAGFSPVLSDVTRSYQVCAVSGTGQYMYVGAGYEHIYKSSDYGVTWSQSTTNIMSGYTGLRCNYAGNIVIRVTLGGYISRSEDFGATWTDKESYRSWTSCAMNRING